MTDKERLTNIIHNAQNKYLNLLKFESSILADYLLANGIIVPPCKVGDTVYTSYDHLSHKQTNEMLKCKVVFIGFGEDGNHINIVDNYGHLHSMNFEIFDKTVFLNREEAAKELRRSKR